MADVERALLSKIVSTGELAEVVGIGIEADHFADDDCAEVYEFMLEFQRRYGGDAPTARVIKTEFPKWQVDIVKEPLGYHIDQFVKKAKERAAIDLVRNYHEAIDDPDQIDNIDLCALEMARNLVEIIPSPRAHLFSAMPGRIKEYDRRKKKDIQHGIFMGIPTFDKATMGYQPTDLGVAVAYFGVGKSTLMQYFAYMAYVQGRISEIVSLEMEGEAILRKLDTLASKVKYSALKALELGVGDYETWSKIAEQAHKDRHERDIVIRDDIKNCTVDKVAAEMLRWKPEVIMVDYLELMHTPRSQRRGAWENVSENGIGLKEIARTMKIPVWTAAQLNREGGKGEVTLGNISYQSVGKHCDILVGMSQDEDREEKDEMELILLKNRDGKKNQKVVMRWELEIMDIEEKGADARFPVRKDKQEKTTHKERIQAGRKMDLARNIDNVGGDNPWAKRVRGDKPKRRRRNRGSKSHS